MDPLHSDSTVAPTWPLLRKVEDLWRREDRRRASQSQQLHCNELVCAVAEPGSHCLAAPLVNPKQGCRPYAQRVADVGLHPAGREQPHPCIATRACLRPMDLLLVSDRAARTGATPPPCRSSATRKFLNAALPFMECVQGCTCEGNCSGSPCCPGHFYTRQAHLATHAFLSTWLLRTMPCGLEGTGTACSNERSRAALGATEQSAVHASPCQSKDNKENPHQHGNGQHGECPCEGAPRGCGVLQTNGLSSVSACRARHSSVKIRMQTRTRICRRLCKRLCCLDSYLLVSVRADAMPEVQCIIR